MISKNNVPYLVAGALATLTLLASGVFAAAPYIGFLAPVAALSVGLPFIIGCAVFSVVTIALSYKAISKNKTISEKDVQLAEKVEEISKKDAQLAKEEDKVQAQEQTISGQNDQLTKKEAEVKAKEEENSKQKIEINKKNEEINNQRKEIEELKHKKTFVPQAMKDIQTASEKAFTSTKEAFISGRVTRIVKDGLKDVYGAMPSTESVKGTLSGIGNKLKNVYGTSVEYTKGALNRVGSSLYSRFHGTKVSSSEEQFKREDGSKPSMQELTRLDYLDLATSKNLNHLNVDISSLKSKSVENCNAKSGDEKDTKISSPENQPTKEENGQSWVAWGKAKVAGIGVCGCVALYYAAPYISTMLEGVSVSSVGSETGYTNDTYYPYQM
ncbi:coiled-coil domain-containing protein [Wolbachia endosymbiont (group A) of Sphaerophoria taeniata]|uniref:hypothetical protein n=1 Tax=Wolbachia endosymbiont (group A) of Sphaerophoria taeniata TaxID=2954057 RepID=UPI002226F58A|nr:hypothetical protein [Wolbachia endosymbiont (group A) of Sphaerophoria taeniata]